MNPIVKDALVQVMSVAATTATAYMTIKLYTKLCGPIEIKIKH